MSRVTHFYLDGGAYSSVITITNITATTLRDGTTIDERQQDSRDATTRSVSLRETATNDESSIGTRDGNVSSRNVRSTAT
jgi:hypothetical protein